MESNGYARPLNHLKFRHGVEQGEQLDIIKQICFCLVGFKTGHAAQEIFKGRSGLFHILIIWNIHNIVNLTLRDESHIRRLEFIS